jgi:hypothetical protein
MHKIGSLEAANVFLREHYIGEFTRRFQVAAAQRGNAFLPVGDAISIWCSPSSSSGQ